MKVLVPQIQIKEITYLGTIFRLTKALNNAIKGMTDAQLKTFINKNYQLNL